MVELGNLNIIIEEGNGAKWVTTEIINFIDLSGVNSLYATNIIYSDSGLVRCKKIYISIDETHAKLKENLFRVEHLFFECNWNRIPEFYKEIRKITTIPVTFITTNNSDFIKIEEFDYAYKTKKGSEKYSTFQSTPISISFDRESYIIKDLKNNWESNIQELRKSWIRNKKLEDLFGEDD